MDNTNSHKQDLKEEKSSGGFRQQISPIGTAVNLFKTASNSAKEQSSLSFKFLTGGFKAVLSRSKRLREINDPERNKDFNPDDFDAVIKSWGMNRGDLPAVKRGLVLELLSYVFLLALLAFGLYTSNTLFTYIILVVVVLMVLFVMLARYWRLWVLKNEEFVFFKDWLTRNY